VLLALAQPVLDIDLHPGRHHSDLSRLGYQDKSAKEITSLLSRLGSIVRNMDKSLLSKYLAELGRKGGKARLKTMTAEKRKAIATKASKAAAKKRTERAQKRKTQNG
jgi:hypothetical protein